MPRGQDNEFMAERRLLSLHYVVDSTNNKAFRKMALRSALAMSVARQTRSPSSFRLGSYGRTLHRLQLQPGTMRYPVRAIQAQPSAPIKDDWKIKMLYDGNCPLCMREVNMLRDRNKDYGTIKFVDISSNDYTPQENQGIDYETAMGRIHAILSDGTVVTDVEAFRKLYEQVGLGWVYAITKYKPVGALADVVYGVWAKYRLQITGRPSFEQVLEARRKSKMEQGEVCGDSNTCKMGSTSNQKKTGSTDC